MADNSPAFTPPMNKIPDSDPQIVRVPLDTVEFGFRKSAAPKNVKNEFPLDHVKNGI